jgi:tetratricopeptide (TPR) repeat protein
MRSIFRALVFAAAVTFAASADAAWRRAESPLFVVYSDGSEKELVEFTQKLEQFDTLLRSFTGTSDRPLSPIKFTVYMVSDFIEFQNLRPHISENLTGFYAADASRTASFAILRDKDGGGPSWAAGQHIVLHEYVHYFTHYFPGRYARWLDEGLAEYFAPATFKDGQASVGVFPTERLSSLHQGMMFTRKLLDPRANLPRSDPDAQVFYPQSLLVTHYFMDDPERRKQLAAYVSATGSGTEPAQAFQDAFGMSFADFDGVAKRYLTGGKGVTRTIALDKKTAEVKVTALPASADDMLLLHTFAMFHSPYGKSREAAARGLHMLNLARERAPKYSDDAFAQRTLAALEIMYGSSEAAGAILSNLIARDPQDLEARYLEMLKAFMDGANNRTSAAVAWSEVKRLGAAVHKLDPNNYGAVYLYALGASWFGNEGMSEDAVIMMRRAHRLAPQVTEIGVEAARSLISVDLRREAAAILEKVATAPHQGTGNVYARVLLMGLLASKSADELLSLRLDENGDPVR